MQHRARAGVEPGPLREGLSLETWCALHQVQVFRSWIFLSQNANLAACLRVKNEAEGLFRPDAAHPYNLSILLGFLL